MNGRLWMLALALIFPTSCSSPTQEDDDSSMQEITEDFEYPFTRILRDGTGRELEAEIHGRSETEVFLIRKSDTQSFRIPIGKLSDLDQSFIRDLPVGMAPASPEERALSDREQAEALLPSQLRFSYRDLDSTIDGIEELVTTIRELESGTMRRKSLSAELERMEDELETRAQKFLGDVAKHLETLGPGSSEYILLDQLRREMDSKRAFAAALIMKYG